MGPLIAGMGQRQAVPRVLVVDDEPDLVDLYAITLGTDYDVETAYGGPEAIECIEADGSFDVAVIDRRMPEVSGDDVLARLHDVNPDCRVAMVTAVEPDFDIVDMPFDEYLVKPVSRVSILETVDRLLRLRSYREQCREDYAVASKLAALRAHKEPEELEGNEEYAALAARLEELREDLEETTEPFGPRDFAAAFAQIDRETPPASQSP